MGMSSLEQEVSWARTVSSLLKNSSRPTDHLALNLALYFTEVMDGYEPG